MLFLVQVWLKYCLRGADDNRIIQITDITLESKIKVTYIIKSVLRLATQIPPYVFTEVVHNWRNDCLLGVDNSYLE